MSALSEFTDDEIATIREMLAQRYRVEVGIELADSELALDAAAAGGAVSCPTVYWHARDANFVVFKIAPFRYRTQFFYTPHDQFGTGIEEYSHLDECVAAVLQTQADHERGIGLADDSSGASSSDPTGDPASE